MILRNCLPPPIRTAIILFVVGVIGVSSSLYSSSLSLSSKERDDERTIDEAETRGTLQCADVNEHVGTDDQIVPIAASALISSKLIRNATLKVYDGAPHGFFNPVHGGGAGFRETADEATKLQDKIDAENLWDLESQVEVAMEALGCPPADSDVTTLSGGERRRVALCQLLLSKPDLLLLDEPTNHLDAESVEWLEQFLARYTGTVVAYTDEDVYPRVAGTIVSMPVYPGDKVLEGTAVTPLVVGGR